LSFESLGNLTLEELLGDFKYWEVWSSDINYTQEPFIACYDNVYRKYVWILVTVGIGEDQQNYVATRLLPGRNSYLLKHCDCMKCLCSDFNPLKKILSPYLTDCIDIGDLVSQGRIRSSKRRQSLNNTWRILDNWVKWIEIFLVIMILWY
jgi:hypothetical protein